jgi:phosphoenolpyruvate---glycerone phosphotransferase subunit DhaL
MDKLTVKDIADIIGSMTDIIIENEVPFCDLDSAAGDGDFGMSLAKGFKVVKESFGELPKDSISALLKAVAMIITEHCGGASGPLWGSAFRSASKAADGKESLSLEDLAAVMNAAVEGIQKRGGAKLGDKTMLDALIPAAESLKNSAAEGIAMPAAMKKSAEEAVAGAEKTKDIVASKGRASYVGERSLNNPDAGAFAIGVILTGIVNKLTQ